MSTPVPQPPAPDVDPASAPRSPGLRRLADLLPHVAVGRLVFQWPDGSRRVAEGPNEGPEGTMIISRDRFVERVARAPDLALAEAYVDGDWDSPDLAALLEVLALNRHVLQPRLRRGLIRRMRRGARLLLGQRQRPVETPFERLGPVFHEPWLDATMSHGLATFIEGDESLEVAQWTGHAALAGRVGLQPDHRVLDFGAGFGAFAAYAAGEIGAQVTAMALNPEEQDYAGRRLQAVGIGDRVQFRLLGDQPLDAHFKPGSFERIVAIGTLELFGEKEWPKILRAMRTVLTPEGQVGLQVVLVPDDAWKAYRADTDPLREHIFPGALLPSYRHLCAVAGKAGLAPAGERQDLVGSSAALTLRSWQDRFKEAWPRLEASGFDARFRRLWTFYLAYAEAAFRTHGAVASLVAFRPA
ncbi:class I SAM-dependent methyltransferase [Marinivivus vitaminiproducens]|uniref:class I SAM-dependent methyltransferase n=1 Tax=Marinivivus vitaminiproducens TaxID=3035935 RepID=UPI00279FD008|nr:class I SAM-dependent methyltransferase [Geminicoccaceae bacterium SCSIO 64248]